MTVATALITGNDPLPQLAEEAVTLALAKAGMTHANGVLLFLTPEFARHAQQTVTAAARTAQCTQVAGGIASGVFTESGWALDRPAAAVMVFGGGLSLGHPEADNHVDHPVLSYAGSTFPPEWSDSSTRFGGTFGGNFTGSTANAEPVVWQQSRLDTQQRCSVQVLGANVNIAVSSGLQLLATAQPVGASNGFDLEKIGGQSALKNLHRTLPADLLEHLTQNLHHLSAVLMEDNDSSLDQGRYRPIAVIAVNPDNSLTLAERVLPGQHLAWAIRQPMTAETDMRETIARLAANSPDPACALVFSCIGRGPFFYGSEDRDLDVLRERFPKLPILGVYGTGQIAPTTSGAQRSNRQLQNAVITALISKQIKEAHVQSIT